MSPATTGIPYLGPSSIALTDGGLETTLVFLEGMDLPCFAAFPLLLDAAGSVRLDDYFRRYLEIAEQRGVGFVLDTPTWRANPDWGERLGYSREALLDIDRRAVAQAQALRTPYVARGMAVPVNGVIGPRGDGYRPETMMTSAGASDYHRDQVRAFAEAGADMVSAVTMNYPQEAVGIACVALGEGLPSVISFTVETDGRLPSGESLQEAIEIVDNETDQLRPSQPFRPSSGGGRPLDRAPRRHKGQCIDEKSRGTGRGDRT